VVARWIRRRVDATNAATLLKLDGAGDPASLFVAGGATLAERRFVELAKLGGATLRDALQAELSPRAALPSSPWRLDRWFERRELAALRREARLRPLSIAVALHYVAEVRAEMRLLRLVLAGGESGLGPDELIGLMEGT
jgi:V/A-type H+-transporting ATPase subunit C